jgi:uncharacterized protein
MSLEFDWDEAKAISNLHKHKVSFEEAKTVFGDPLAKTILDPEHSIDESRFLDLGESDTGKLLIVSYTQRKEIIRIISCRKATATERKMYEENHD